MIHWNEVAPYKAPRAKILPQITQVDGEPEMSEDESAFLCGLIRDKTPATVMEVGIAGGGTTAILLQCLSDLDYACTMYSVDVSERFYRDPGRKSGFLGEEALKLIHPPGIRHEFLLGSVACEWCDKKNINGIDFLILDTAHIMPGEVLDMITLLPYLKDGAVVVLHDTSFNTASTEKHGYATSLLMAAVTADRYLNFKSGDYCPNISAFVVDQSTRDHVEQLFLALMVTWKYSPDPSQIDSYRRIVNTYYDRKLIDLFETIVSVQRASVLTWKKEYRFPFNLVKRGERIILYGAGPAGQEAVRQMAETDWVDCAGRIDFRYDMYPDLRVQSPDIIRTIDFDRIVIIICDDFDEEEIVRDLVSRYGVEESKLLCDDPSI